MRSVDPSGTAAFPVILGAPRCFAILTEQVLHQLPSIGTVRQARLLCGLRDIPLRDIQMPECSLDRAMVHTGILGVR